MGVASIECTSLSSWLFMAPDMFGSDPGELPAPQSCWERLGYSQKSSFGEMINVDWDFRPQVCAVSF